MLEFVNLLLAEGLRSVKPEEIELICLFKRDFVLQEKFGNGRILFGLVSLFVWTRKRWERGKDIGRTARRSTTF